MKIQLHVHNSTARVLLSLVLALAALGPLAAPRRAQALGPYVVTSATDGNDTALDGVCLSTGGGCSLRAALQEAANDGGPTTITFDGSLLLVPQVLNDGLGAIDWTGNNITVTGSSSIIVSGASLTLGKSIFEISGSHNLLKGIHIQDGPGDGVQVGDLAGAGTGNDNRLEALYITGNGGAGVYVRGGGGGGGQRNVVAGSVIGLANNGATSCGADDGNFYGVYIGLSAVDTLVSTNLMACSATDGITVDGAGGSPAGTQLLDNAVGVTNGAPGNVGNGLAGIAIFGGARGVTASFNTISGNTQQGVYIAGAATQNVTLSFNEIGLQVGGAAARPNGQGGILVSGLVTANVGIQGNIISGNFGNGVTVDASGYLTLTGNTIGLNPAGSVARANSGDGVALVSDAHHIVLGGNTPAARNLISGNANYGVRLSGAGTTQNRIEGNTIGANAAGAGARPNGLAGVLLEGSAHDNTVGSPGDAGAGNLISGNATAGVYLTGGAHHNHVDGNLIGLGATAAPLPNVQDGVFLSNAPNNFIGSAGAINSQYISGNGLAGIAVLASNTTYIGASNLIGVNSLARPAGNGRGGIVLNNSSNVTVLPEQVAYNGEAGISVGGIAVTTVGNLIHPIFVGFNGGLPIDLAGDGHTPNDAGDTDTGPNTLLNYPTITSVAGIVASGAACAGCMVYLYRAYGNPAARGGGGVWLGSAIANGSGAWSFGALPPGLSRLDLSAAACDAPCTLTGNTSEMSPRWSLSLPLVLR